MTVDDEEEDLTISFLSFPGQITNLKMTVKTQTFDGEEPMDMRDGPAGCAVMPKKPSKIKASRTPGKSWFKNSGAT